MNCATAITSLAVIILINCIGGECLAFGTRPFISGSGRKLTKRTRNAPTSLMMTGLDDLVTMMPLFESIDPTASVLLASAASDPQLELELMNDVSHVALDVSTLMNPNTVWLRLCNVVGRILIITSDYIQKGNTTPDEWVFQLAMLAISTRLFLGSALPVLFAIFSVSTLSVRDRRIYSLLFESVGLTVLQFKTLLASATLDWVQYEPNEKVELDGSHMYFLYSGDITSQVTANKNEESVSDVSISNDAELGVSNRVFGVLQFASALETSVYKKTTKSSKSDKKSRSQVVAPLEGNSTTVAASSFVVGSKGASMLRISKDKITKLMKNDNELTSSIQRLVSLFMQEKLSRYLREGNVGQSSNVSSSSVPNSTQVIFML